MLVLGWFDGDGVLDVARNNGVLGTYFEHVGVIDVVVVVSADEALVPPLDVGRGFDYEILLDINVLIYAGFSGLGSDLLLEGLERGLAAQGGGLLDVFALLVEDELAGLSRLGRGSAEAGVIVWVALDLFGRGAREIDGLRLLGLGRGRGFVAVLRIVAAGFGARFPLAKILESRMKTDIQASLSLAGSYGCRHTCFEGSKLGCFVYRSLGFLNARSAIVAGTEARRSASVHDATP